jgi:hypothetical protein
MWYGKSAEASASQSLNIPVGAYFSLLIKNDE